MKNKGFTLVEMIAVLVIIVLIFVVSFPPILNALKSTQVKVDESIFKIIGDSVDELLSQESITYNKKDNNKYCITIKELIEKNYLEEELIQDLDQNTYATIQFENGKTKLSLTTSCVQQVDDIYFALNGEKDMILTQGSTYSEPGFIALDEDGIDISSKVKIKVHDYNLKEYDSIDTSIINEYIIEYELISGTNYLVLERKVKIDNDGKPVITHPGNDVISIKVTSYDVLEGVSAVDSSGNSLQVIAKTDLSLGIVGEYTITYTATDGAGNTSVARRLIQINDRYVERLLNGADPILAPTMYPIIYDEAVGNWKVVTVYDKWYSYEERMWANVVILDSGKPALNPGDYVNVDNVNSFMVWIPRYEYKINYRTDGLEYDPNYGPYAIDISFNASDTPSSPDFIIHSGFQIGDVENTGFWVDKFEQSTLSTASITHGYKAVYRSVPNVVSLVDVRLADNWWNIRDMQQLVTGTSTFEKFDTHLVKATEWGTICYLAYSLYGRCDSPTHCTQVSLNDSVGFYTGRSAGLNKPDGTKDAGSYVYNDLTYGVMASTTGTIYGVYDMSGGRAEQNMTLVYSSDGVNPVTGGCLGTILFGKCIGQTQSTGFNGMYVKATDGLDVDLTGEHNWKVITDGVTRPDDKYIDYYDYNLKKLNGAGPYTIIEKPGDGMSDLRPIQYGSNSGRRGWFGDRIDGPNAAYPALVRGGSSMLDVNDTLPEYSNYDEIGIFTASDSSGMTGSTIYSRLYTTRKVITVD